MTKQDRIDNLIFNCKQLAKLQELSKQKTEDLQKMANLARAGEKDSERFKELDKEYKYPTVIDYGDVVRDIVNIVKYL